MNVVHRFVLRPVPPFRLDLTAWTLRRSPRNDVDRWDGTTYSRVLAIGSHAVSVAVSQDHDQLDVVVRAARPVAALEQHVGAILDRLLGLSLDLRPFYRMAARDPKLLALVDPYRGVRPPRFATVFEGLLNGISCQQLSLAAGLTVFSRLTARVGLTAPDSARHACPRPEDLARRRPASLRAIGYSGAKARAMLSAARAIVRGDLDLEQLAGLDNRAALDRLLGLPGVGRWTAEYVLLRSLGRLSVFPADDVGARNGLRRWLGVKRPLDYDGVHRLLAPWHPWGGLIYFHMLLRGLDASGRFTAPGDRRRSRPAPSGR